MLHFRNPRTHGCRAPPFASGGCCLAIERSENSGIIFIDELDAIAQNRKFSAFGSQESDTTLNQLLVNMDGLSKDEGGNVIVIDTDLLTCAPEKIADTKALQTYLAGKKVFDRAE